MLPACLFSTSVVVLHLPFESLVISCFVPAHQPAITVIVPPFFLVNALSWFEHEVDICIDLSFCLAISFS
jgi:hypothetical protein